MIKGYCITEVHPLQDPQAFVDITRMHKICFPNDMMYLPDAGYWWLVQKEGEPSTSKSTEFAGFAGLVKVKSDLGMGFLCRAGVLGKHRGKGIQRELIDVRVRKARLLKMKSVVSSTFDNPPSANNLIAAGFRMYMPAEPWGAEGTNYWVLNLKKD